MNKDISRLEQQRSASFVLIGVVAARSPEAGKRTHEAITNVCSAIMNAYEVANSPKKSRDEKVQAIKAVCELGEELDWLVNFTREETEWNRFEEERAEMNEIHQTVKGQKDFLGLRVSIERFSEVFETLLALLEEMTEFLKLGHKCEVKRVRDSLDNAYAESRNLHNCELVQLLVDQSKLASTRANDAWKAVDQLVKIQPGRNEDLRPRIDTVDQMLRSALPDFIMRTKDVLTQPGSPSHKHNQDQAYRQVTACLDEISRILALIEADYVNQFDESAKRVTAHLDPLEAACKGVVKAVADFRGALLSQEPELVRLELADEIAKFTKVAIEELTKLGAPDSDKRAVVEAVKRMRDGDMEDFFAGQQEINDILERARNRPPPLQMSVVDESDASRSKDLLQAAKDMCSALSKLNIAMDE